MPDFHTVVGFAVQQGQLEYLPLAPWSFSILVGVFVLLAVLLQVGALQYAYMHLGISAAGALFLLLGSLLGSYFNIPIAELPGQRVVSGAVVTFYGMQYMVPVIAEWPGTVIAVNVGGALIPTLMSIYLLARNKLWVRGGVATIVVAAVCHALASPVPGVGIALPVFVPALSAAVVALLLSRRRAARLAYIGGSLGCLIGADLLNLDKLQGLGAPVASIGGAGTFNGVFLVGALAVIIASFPRRSGDAGGTRRRGSVPQAGR